MNKSDIFMAWWAEVNMQLTLKGCAEILFGTATALFREGVPADVAATREARFQKGDAVA